jgi:hypothetical protein
VSAPVASKRVLTDAEIEALIAKRAYELYEQRLRRSAFDDWLDAEREILSMRLAD